MTTVTHIMRSAIPAIIGLIMAASQASAAIYFEPVEVTVAEFDTFTVEIKIDADVVGVHCFRVHLGFDRTDIRLLGATEGPLMPTGGSTFFYEKDTSGIFDIFDCIYNPPEGSVSGPGILVNLEFTTGETPCASPLELQYVLLQDTDLDSLPVTVGNGSVAIEGCCACPHQGDIDANGVPDAIDLNLLIDVLFFGGLDVQDPSCPVSRCDIDMSGYPDALDLNLYIDYLFFGGSPPPDPCPLASQER